MIPLSIYIPTFRRPQLLKYSLNSIFKSPPHLLLDIHVIVSSNGKDPKTQMIVEEFKNKNLNLTYHEQAVNMGIDFNMMHFRKYKISDYCLLLGDDDVLLDGGLDFILSAIKQRSDDYAFILLNSIDFKEKFIPVTKKNRLTTEENLILTNSPSVFTRYWDKMPFGTLVFNMSKIDNVNVERFMQTSHAYSSLVWELLGEDNNAKGLILAKPTIGLRVCEKTWGQDALSVFYKEIPEWFDLIHGCFNQEAKAVKSTYMNAIYSSQAIIRNMKRSRKNQESIETLLLYATERQRQKVKCFLLLPDFVLTLFYALNKPFSFIKSMLER